MVARNTVAGRKTSGERKHIARNAESGVAPDPGLPGRGARRAAEQGSGAHCLGLRPLQGQRTSWGSSFWNCQVRIRSNLLSNQGWVCMQDKSKSTELSGCGRVSVGFCEVRISLNIAIESDLGLYAGQKHVCRTVKLLSS